MNRTGLISGIFVFFMAQVTYGGTVSDFNDFKVYNGYEIITDGGVPKVRVYGGGVALFSLNIDGSLLSEYVMARLLHMNSVSLKVNYEAGTPGHYRFTYWSSSDGNHYSRNMGAIGFYENGVGGVTLEVFLDANIDGVLSGAELTSANEYVLSPGYSSEEKLKFDFLVSSVVNYLANTGAGSESVQIVSPDGIRFIY